MRITDLYRLDEMPRPAGTLSAPIRGALELARQSGQPFTAKQFAEWVGQSGGTNTNPMSLQTILRRMSAPRRSAVDSSTPLMVVTPGARGKGKAGTWQYVFGGSAGVAPKAPPASQGMGRPTPPSMGQGAAPSDTDDDDEDLGPGWTKVPNEPEGDEPAEPPGGPEPDEIEEPDEGEFYGEPVDVDDEVGQGADVDDEGPEWLPQPDPMSSDVGESMMAKLADNGFGPENPFWQKIARANSDVEVGNLVRAELPMTMRQAGIRVAKAIFQKLGKDWEAPARESRSLTSLYGLGESQTDPVDFDQTSGLTRIMRVKR